MKPADSNEAVLLREATEKKPRRSRFEKLYAEHEAMERKEAKDAGALAFVARFLVQASLPYRRAIDKQKERESGEIVELASWTKTNGITVLILQSGWEPAKNGERTEDGRVKSVPIGLPFGCYPRLVLAWMTTEVIRTKSPVIQLGESVSDFMNKLGVHTTGGKTGALTAVRNQLYRLLNTTIRVVPVDERRKNFQNIQIGLEGDTGGELWWKKKAEAQTNLWIPHFQLSENFFQLLSSTVVPIDMRAYRRLAQSPMAMDIYTFATYRLRSVQDPQGLFIPWRTLEAQMGGGSSLPKFVENFKRALKQVQVVYPEANMVPKPDGLRCFRSIPSVKSAA